MPETYNTILKDIDGQSQLLIAALNATISGVLITDWRLPDNPIIYCNHAFEEMTGYCLEEVRGKNCRFLQGTNREQIGRHKIHEAIGKDEDCHAELANYRKDGSVFYNEVYITPIRNSIGAVTHYIGIQNDITIRKLRETSLLLELANERKLQIKKDEFVSVAGHELKTPITSLKGTLQLMNKMISEGAQIDERLLKLSQQAERNTNKLTYIVDDLLNSSSIIEGKLALNKTTFSIQEIVEGCCHHLTINSGHRLRTIGDSHFKLYADQQKITQVVVNFIANAVRYAPETNEIVIQTERLTDKVKVAVIDKGNGISEVDKADIFSRYRQSGENNSHQSGFGLGLYTSAEIIRQHGGEIGVESEPGKGAKFWFTLPC